jgi:hypothetical protein
MAHAGDHSRADVEVGRSEVPIVYSAIVLSVWIFIETSFSDCRKGSSFENLSYSLEYNKQTRMRYWKDPAFMRVIAAFLFVSIKINQVDCCILDAVP